MEDLVSALNRLNIESPFDQMKDGLYQADLGKVLKTIESLTATSADTAPRDTRNELVRFYSEVVNERHRLYINPADCQYLEHF